MSATEQGRSAIDVWLEEDNIVINPRPIDPGSNPATDTDPIPDNTSGRQKLSAQLTSNADAHQEPAGTERRRAASMIEARTEERDQYDAVIDGLVKVGTGEMRHLFNGVCPDMGGFDDRDPECPACQTLESAQDRSKLAARDAAKKRSK